MATYSSTGRKITGNTSGSNGMPSNVVGGGTSYADTGTNLTDRGYPGSVGTTTGTGTVSTTSVNTSGTGSSTGGSSTGGSSGSSGSGSSVSSNNADAYNSLLAAYRGNDYSGYLNQMNAAAQGAYDRGMSALNSAFDAEMNSLNSNLAQTQETLGNQYGRSRKSIMDDAANSLRQAYINKMKSERNLAQQMAALGLNGGATETTLAGMLNNYGNARNEINTTQNDNLSDLEGNYEDNLAAALQAYNSAVAQAELQKANQQMQLENALANNQIANIGNYQSLMQRENENYLNLLNTAIANGANVSFTPTVANNGLNAVGVTQAVMPTTTNNLNAANALTGNIAGVATPGITVLSTPNATATNTLQDTLNQLYGV